MSLDEAFDRARREREKQLYAAGVSQLSIVEREYGFVEIRFYPSLDGVVAGSVLYSLLRGKGVQAWLVADPLPPERVEKPSILIGYEPSIAISLEYRAPSIVIARGEKPQGLTRAALVAAREASLTGLAVGMMSEILVVGDRGLLGLAMAYWLGLDRDKRGDLIGPEAWLAELFETENRVASQLTIKLFDWFEKSIDEALASTLDPLYVGLTGDLEAVRRFLASSEETAALIGTRLLDAPEEAVTKLGEMLYQHLRSTSKAPRRATEVIGVTRYTLRLPVRDLRRLPLVIASWLEARGILATVPLPSSLDALTRLADMVYHASFEATVTGVERIAKNPSFVEQRSYGPVRVCIHRSLPDDAVYPIVAKQLRLLGYYPPDCLAAVDAGNRIEVLLDDALAEVKPERLREAFRRGCLRYIPDTLYAEARPC